MFFILDNLFSQARSKTVQVSVWEEWDETPSNLDLVTTTPPQDRSLSNDVKKMISSAKHSLKIITPYIDMLLVSELLEQQEKGLSIIIITRSKKEFSGKDTKTAFDHIHDALKQNHRANDLVHSRVLICDDTTSLVSSADLTQDSLIGQFNAGIILSDVSIINKLNSYFNQVWQKSTKIN